MDVHTFVLKDYHLKVIELREHHNSLLKVRDLDSGVTYKGVICIPQSDIVYMLQKGLDYGGIDVSFNNEDVNDNLSCIINVRYPYTNDDGVYDEYSTDLIFKITK